VVALTTDASPVVQTPIPLAETSR